MPTCENCDEFVTAQFVRVFGVDGEVHGCTSCKAQGRPGEYSGLNSI